MPDPIRDLEQLPTEGLAVNPLSPADVRRRGDRMRRRRHAAAAALAGAAAVALVVVPLAVFAGGEGERSEQPPVATSPADPGRIPDGFPLTAGWPEDGTDPHLVGPAHDDALADDFLVCDRPLPQRPHKDVLAAELHDVDDVRFRWLTTYAAPRAARQAVADVRAAWETCPREETIPGNTPTAEWRHRVADVALAGAAADSFGVDSELTTATGEGIGRQTRYVSLRVGRAVLSGMWWTRGSEPDPEARDALVQAMAEDAAVPVAAMCPYAEDPCARQPGQPEQSGGPGADGDWLTEIPEGFPLEAGIDTAAPGIGAPEVSPDGPGLGNLELCSRRVWPATSVDRLAAEVPGTESGPGRQRELLLFPSDRAATAAMAALRDQLGACPSETTTDGAIPGEEFEVLHTGYPVADPGADESVTWTQAYADGGIGTEVLQLVRIGNAIAGTRLSSESNKDGVAAQVPALTAESRGLVRAMCVFAPDPCA